MSRCPECTRLGRKAPSSDGPVPPYLCTNEACPVYQYAGRVIVRRKPVVWKAALEAIRRLATP